MTAKMVTSAILWAMTVGGLLAILNGDQRAVSLRIWLAGFTVWFAVATVRRLFEGVPLIPSRMRLLIALRSKLVPPRDGRPRELRWIEGLLFRSRDNERAYGQQLRPRLLKLADHYLPMNHGIDRHGSPERAATLLDEVAWIVEPESDGRTPTFDELDTFLQILVSSTRTGAEEVA